MKAQIFVSTLLMIPTLYLCAQTLPDTFSFENVSTEDGKNVTPRRAFICTLLGLLAGLLIGWVTERQTSFSYAPV